jgi:succinyl-CoA synthetase beta subunit
VILINCFGGALNLGHIGNALTLLFKHFEFTKPIIARLKGAGNELANIKLKEIGYGKLYLTDDYD